MCKEVGNAKDKYAISILRSPDVVVAHLPLKISISRISTNGGSWNITQHIFIMLQISHRFNYSKSIQPQK